jgi:hypothetical protein
VNGLEVSANGAWVLRNGEVYLGPFSTRRIAGELLAESVLSALQAAYAEGKRDA